MFDLKPESPKLNNHKYIDGDWRGHTFFYGACMDDGSFFIYLIHVLGGWVSGF